MKGMNIDTGRPVRDGEHLEQSLRILLSTPIGSRVMRRDYGSGLADLMDRPLNAESRLDIYAAVATAIRLWEPRLHLSKVALEPGSSDGQVTMTLTGIEQDSGASLTLAGVVA